MSNRAEGTVQDSIEERARRYLKINGTWQDHDLFALLQDDARA